MTADVLLSDVAAQRDLDATEARHLIDRMRADVATLGERVTTAYLGRAWVALGYESWDAMTDAEFPGARLRIPREQRSEQVQSLRAAGLSTRAIGSALGVHHDTVASDIKAATVGNPTVDSPTTVRSLDGRNRPAAQPPRPAPAPVVPLADAVARYPELEHYANRPEKAAALANALDRYDDTERTMRREVLGKRIAAEQAGRMNTPDDTAPEAVWHAEQMFASANATARLISQHGTAASFAEALHHTDPLLTQTWQEQFRDLAATCAAIADACTTTTLRRIK